MEITEEISYNVVTLDFNGRLDAVAVKECKETMKSLADRKKTNIVIDLEYVDFIDSSGLGVLVSSLRTINKIGGNIKICALQEQVRSIFELTRLHRIFEIFVDADTAAKSFVR